MSLLLALAPALLSRSDFNLRGVANLAKVNKVVALGAAHRRALAKNGFFTCPSDDKALYWVYGVNDYREIPSIVTTDNVLQIYHVFFDSTLRKIEETKLLPDVLAMSDELLSNSIADYDNLKSGPLAEAALRNVVYFGVAGRLVGSTKEIPKYAEARVEKELAAIKAHEGFALSSNVGADVDYSQFIVRGHYTKSPKLGQYFQSMMWYGLVPFATKVMVNGRVLPATTTVRQSLLIARNLEDGPVAARWKRIYGATALFAGTANDLTPPEWRAIDRKVFGPSATPKAYEDAASIARFVAAVDLARPPKIVTKRQKGTVAMGGQFRLMGQRSIPDSIVLQRLSDAEFRPFPSPLDVFSVLGSARATKILDANPGTYNPKGWREYDAERSKLRGEFDALSPKERQKDLYASWIDTLRLSTSSVPTGAPAFMRSSAWADKSLYSALASWAELRHDTILYGLQSVAEMGDGEEPVFVPGYVEPNPAVYDRLLALVKQTAAGVKSRGYLSPEIGEQYATLQKLLAFFADVSRRELAGKRLTKDEHQRIRFIEGELESLHNTIQKIAGNYQMLSEDDLDIALVADVHTARGLALTVGVGRADHLYAIVPIEGKNYLARGSTLSYYEFRQPISKRMKDQEWKAQLNADKAPPRPDWIKSFFVPVPLKYRD